MSQKKRVISETAQKQQFKNKLTTYIERYREIELYLTLLTKPLLPNLIPTTSVGMEDLYNKVETEIKGFLEEKLQVLTGLAPQTSPEGLSKDELAALKMVASSIMKKAPLQIEPMKEDVKSEFPLSVMQEPEPEDEMEVAEQVLVENDHVVVEQLEESPIARRGRKKKGSGVVLPTEVPVVERGVPTDTMKRTRPSGVKPLPPPTPEQEAHFAAQNEHIHQQLLAAQMAQAQTVMPDNLGMPNLANPMFR